MSNVGHSHSYKKMRLFPRVFRVHSILSPCPRLFLFLKKVLGPSGSLSRSIGPSSRCRGAPKYFSGPPFWLEALHLRRTQLLKDNRWDVSSMPLPVQSTLAVRHLHQFSILAFSIPDNSRRDQGGPGLPRGLSMRT